jgi:microcystin-dependent protein
LTQAQLPAVAPTFTGSGSTSSQQYFTSGTGTITGLQNGGGAAVNQNTVTITPSGTISNLGSGNAHSIVPPMLTANCLVRVLP